MNGEVGQGNFVLWVTPYTLILSCVSLEWNSQ